MVDVFVHIPKTGGTTLNTTLKWIYNPWRCCRINPEGGPSPELFKECDLNFEKSVDLVSGHVHYGIHKYIKPKCRYFTMLRNPIKRYISRYYHLKLSYGAGMSLKEFCHSNHGWSTTNQLVRYVSNKNPESSESALPLAKKKLVNDFAVFGILRQFEESLLLFREKLGWTRPPFYVPVVRNPKRPTVENIPSRTIDLVKRKNKLDIDLYDFAIQNFRSTISSEFDNVSEEVNRFGNKNEMVQKVAPLVLRLYRGGRSVLDNLS